MEERLQKFLAASGVCSRRKAEELILAGRVSVNGRVVTVLGAKVNAVDKVIVDGKLVSVSRHIYVMLHKPEGYITSACDQFGRPTVMDLVTRYNTRLYPVGRLDYDTSGLLLLTNDGELTQALTHPSRKVEKVYIARIKGILTPDEIERFRAGLRIEDYTTAPAGIHIVKSFNESVSVKITVHEGRNRQIRKMCEAIGHSVIFLKRVATGRLYLGDLPRSASRELTEAEVRYLKGLKGPSNPN
ncbi:MAG: rRNA pseudouridine synthase [Clostridiales bacterium]|jgi:pseudouridine synthase|nr:rRNA pseudouridine synthase [Clostridiales bacterium]